MTVTHSLRDAAINHLPHPYPTHKSYRSHL